MHMKQQKNSNIKNTQALTTRSKKENYSCNWNPLCVPSWLFSPPPPPEITSVLDFGIISVMYALYCY